MKTADLYIRVSTDEQADKGYSQRDQEERLRKYCSINAVQIRKVIYEDHSAKTFNRPEWIKLLAEYKKRKAETGLVLFIKWDRFSRNAGDAYQMISILGKLGIEPQAVEQPLDLSIPENKMMLAFYLAAPEVENDRRALNTFYGMRRAKKEGRWVSAAPIGYVNKTSEDGRKYIAPKEPQAALVKWVFKELAASSFAADQIRKEAVRKGLKCGRNNFWKLIRNPVYCGKIFVPKHKDEEACFVQGQHEPIIPETLFYQVQDVLDGKKRSTRPNTKLQSDENLPLRGFLCCPRCGRMITGSASRGKYHLYYYYHCISSCGFRHRADKANELFIQDLKKFIPHPAVLDLSREIITLTYKNQIKDKQVSSRLLIEEINKLNNRLSKARELLLTDAIDAGNYKVIKAECEPKMNRLEAQLAELKKSNAESADITKQLDKALTTLTRLDILYKNGTITQKRNIISSIYPEKICFDGLHYRTPRLNSAVSYIYQISRELAEIKKGKDDIFYHLSPIVARRGIEPLFQE